MKNISHSILISAISVICLLFFAAVALDISPYLRGPNVAEWRWPYQFVNTLNKVLLPLVVIDIALFAFRFLEKRTLNKVITVLILLGLVALSFLWQISVVSFSRAGDGVLERRIGNAGINGYYTAGVRIKDPVAFVRDFPKIVLDLPMHAKGHPPGMDLFFYALYKITGNLYTTILSARLLIPLLSGLAIIPLYFLTKSWKAVFLYLSIPSLSLFLPLPDVLFPFFGVLSWFLVKTKKDFLAGLVFATGLFFSYSILPILLFLALQKPRKIFYLPIIIYFLLFWETFITVIGGQAPRSYFLWIFYNLWDVIVFTGIPLVVLFLAAIKKQVDARYLLVTILALNFSGLSRAETGRIWLPLMVLMIPPVADYLETKKFKVNLVAVIIALQMAQTLVLQEFWVPLW